MQALVAFGTAVAAAFATKAIAGGGGGKAIVPLQSATRDDASAQVSMQDALARRRGAAADILTGTTGAQATGAQVGRFVAGS